MSWQQKKVTCYLLVRIWDAERPVFPHCLFHPSSRGKDNFGNLSYWDCCWVASALHINSSWLDKKVFPLKFFCLNKGELMSSKFITSISSSILLSMRAAILSMVFDEDDFPHLTINLEIFFSFPKFSADIQVWMFSWRYDSHSFAGL